MNDGVLLKVEEVTAGYTEPLVGPLSLTLKSGEVVGIRGPNGSGKSTFLASLVGASRVFSGRIDKRPDLRIVFMRQKPLPVKGIPFCASELLALTGASAEGIPSRYAPQLGERLDALSGGQLQFFTLWPCLNTRADIVLLDEPTNNLDAESIAELARLLCRKRDEGRGVFVVSHDERFIDAVCDRTVNFE